MVEARRGGVLHALKEKKVWWDGGIEWIALLVNDQPNDERFVLITFGDLVCLVPPDAPGTWFRWRHVRLVTNRPFVLII